MTSCKSCTVIEVAEGGELVPTQASKPTSGLEEVILIESSKASSLRDNSYNITKTLSQLEEYLELDTEKRNTLQSILQRIREKSIDLLEGEWWNHSLDFEPKVKKRSDSLPVNISVSSSSESKAPKFVHHRNNVDDVSLKQQLLRLSSVLGAIRTLAEIEHVSEVKIAALALQTISNQSHCRQVAQVSKLIAHDNYPGQFGHVAKKDLDLNKSLLLLDMLEIGKRKYTQLRQLLLSSDIRFRAYQNVIDQRNNIVLRSSLLLYPNSTTPIGVSVSYSEFVLHTFKRIMATISSPSPKNIPLSYQIQMA